MTASDASVVGSRHFDSFGDPRGPIANVSQQPYAYTGQEQDPELGLVNMHGRMYDARLGQFMSADPEIQEPYGQGLNRFAYVFNSPMNFTDPSGFSAEEWETGLGLGVPYTGGLVATLLSSGGSAAAVGGGEAAAFAAPEAAAAGAGASLAEVANVAGPGAGIASSLAFNTHFSSLQPKQQLADVKPPSRSATASAGGPAAVGSGDYANKATSPVRESVGPQIKGGAEPTGRVASPKTARSTRPTWDGNEAVFCGQPGAPKCVMAPPANELTPTDHLARDFIAKHVRDVHADQEEVGASIDRLGDRLRIHAVNQGGPNGTNITYNPRTVVSTVHLHPGVEPEQLTFSGLDIDTANSATEALSRNITSYISVNNGQYVLRYDPGQYTVTFLPGVWGQLPGGFIP